MQRQIANAAARHAQLASRSANDNAEACVLATNGVPTNVSVVPVAATAPAPAAETTAPVTPASVTCGVALPKAVHTELCRRAAVNKTTIKAEALKAILRDM